MEIKKDRLMYSDQHNGGILTNFFCNDEKEDFKIHSLISLGDIGIAIPFIIKAYKFGLPISELSKLCSSLELLVIRHRLIKTSADITLRLNDVYQNFKEDNSTIEPIIEHIEWMKNVGSESQWWAYWNNKEFERALHREIDHSTAIFLLWKYENYLASQHPIITQGLLRFSPMRFQSSDFELDYIAPQTENPKTGYAIYDEEFISQHINCIGNYVLIITYQSGYIGNEPFANKRSCYVFLEQQREIQEMTKDNPIWTADLIKRRKEKIIHFLMKDSTY